MRDRLQEPGCSSTAQRSLLWPPPPGFLENRRLLALPPKLGVFPPPPPNPRNKCQSPILWAPLFRTTGIGAPAGPEAGQGVPLTSRQSRVSSLRDPQDLWRRSYRTVSAPLQYRVSFPFGHRTGNKGRRHKARIHSTWARRLAPQKSERLAKGVGLGFESFTGATSLNPSASSVLPRVPEFPLI